MKEKIANKYKTLQNDLEKRVETGRLGTLSLFDVKAVCSVGKELLEKHVASTFIKNVAEYFEKFGFKVTMDFNNTNYVIVEV